MKSNAPKRKIFDAVDLLTEDASTQVLADKRKNGVTMLSIDSIKPFHDHPIHLYEGDRLEDIYDSEHPRSWCTESGNRPYNRRWI